VPHGPRKGRVVACTRLYEDFGTETRALSTNFEACTGFVASTAVCFVAQGIDATIHTTRRQTALGAESIVRECACDSEPHESPVLCIRYCARNECPGCHPKLQGDTVDMPASGELVSRCRRDGVEQCGALECLRRLPDPFGDISVHIG
jgi:hypothetical protein